MMMMIRMMTIMFRSVYTVSERLQVERFRPWQCTYDCLRYLSSRFYRPGVDAVYGVPTLA